MEEAGGGEAEGFEQSEALLMENATEWQHRSPIADAEQTDEDERAFETRDNYGDADDEDPEDYYIEEVIGGDTNGPATLPELVGAIDATGGYDGVTGRLGGRRFRVFRDPHELITGRASTMVRVVGRG